MPPDQWTYRCTLVGIFDVFDDLSGCDAIKVPESIVRKIVVKVGEHEGNRVMHRNFSLTKSQPVARSPASFSRMHMEPEPAAMSRTVESLANTLVAIEPTHS